MSQQSVFKTEKLSRITGELSVPGDKSISHRAIMTASLADGTSQFSNFLTGDDCLRTIHAFGQMGVSIEQSGTNVKVHGVGLTGLSAPKTQLDLGNSGTSIRLLLGILAFQKFSAVLTGDLSLSSRPMRRVTLPLRKMGALISGRDDANFTPLEIRGAKLSGIRHSNEPASAQVKSAILFAGLQADGETIVTESIVSRDHTERILEMAGANLSRNGHVVTVSKTNSLKSLTMTIPGDISSAAFWIIAAIIAPNSAVTIKNVGLNPTRIGILEVLKAMNADIRWEIKGSGVEPAGNIYARSSNLKAIKISRGMMPRLIDELPILLIACSLADGESVVSGAEELRVKETDRIVSMVQGINQIGGRARETQDGCIINGVSQFTGGSVSSFKDHRTAMSFIVAGLRSEHSITIDDVDCIATSYPGFFKDLKLLSRAV